MGSKEKNEACLSFLENIFTKSVHRGGVSFPFFLELIFDQKYINSYFL